MPSLLLTIAIAVVLLASAALVTQMLLRRERPRTSTPRAPHGDHCPPVVELARIHGLARLQARARTSRGHTPPPPPPPPPLVPFAQIHDPVDPATPAHPLAPTDPQLPVAPILPGQQITHPTSGPYAAPLIQGQRLTLPGSPTADKDIVFYSRSPQPPAVVAAGDSTDRLRITGTDGRIHLPT